MDDVLLEKICKIGLVREIIYKAQEIIQCEDIGGGHRGYCDDLLNDIQHELDKEISKLKLEMTEGVEDN